MIDIQVLFRRGMAGEGSKGPVDVNLTLFQVCKLFGVYDDGLWPTVAIVKKPSSTAMPNKPTPYQGRLEMNEALWKTTLNDMNLESGDEIWFLNY